MTFSTIQPRRFLPTIGLILAIGVSGVLHASEGEVPQILAAVDNAKWRAECSGCHMLYHPALLPERSWRKMMSGLDQHFGKQLKLNATAQKEITDFLVAHAAERSNSSRAQRIAKNTQADQIPLRITETAYFSLQHHDDIGAEVWQRPAVGGKANCKACHAEAEKGNFDEKAIRIPR